MCHGICKSCIQTAIQQQSKDQHLFVSRQLRKHLQLRKHMSLCLCTLNYPCITVTPSLGSSVPSGCLLGLCCAMGKAVQYNLDIAAHDFQLILDSARQAFQSQDADMKNLKIKEVADRANVSNDIIQIQRYQLEKGKAVQKSKSKKGNAEVIKTIQKSKKGKA